MCEWRGQASKNIVCRYDVSDVKYQFVTSVIINLPILEVEIFDQLQYQPQHLSAFLLFDGFYAVSVTTLARARDKASDTSLKTGMKEKRQAIAVIQESKSRVRK